MSGSAAILRLASQVELGTLSLGSLLNLDPLFRIYLWTPQLLAAGSLLCSISNAKGIQYA
jgi:hypothetical protein